MDPRDLPPRRPGTHHHVCRCGNVLTCRIDAEHCPLPAGSWICPTCELKALDEYYERHQELMEPAPRLDEVVTAATEVVTATPETFWPLASSLGHRLAHQMAAPGIVACGASSDPMPVAPYCCTRPLGHAGSHAAHTSDGTLIVTWEP